MEEYVRTCNVRQTTNDAMFSKQEAALHPIAIKPEVWRQEEFFIICHDFIFLLVAILRLQSKNVKFSYT